MGNKYNGWKNYAKWRVNLEIFDCFDIQGYPIDVYELSLGLKQFAEDSIEYSTPNGVAKDYAMAFLSDVDFYEIAKHLVEAKE